METLTTSSSPESNPDAATDSGSYDDEIKTVTCTEAVFQDTQCHTGDLVKGRGTMSGGNEPHYSNMIDGCPDGYKGTF